MRILWRITWPCSALILAALPLAGCSRVSPGERAAAQGEPPAPTASCGYSAAQCEVLAAFGTPDSQRSQVDGRGRDLEIWQWDTPSEGLPAEYTRGLAGAEGLELTFAGGRLIDPRPDLRFYRLLRASAALARNPADAMQGATLPRF